MFSFVLKRQELMWIISGDKKDCKDAKKEIERCCKELSKLA